MAFLLTGQLPHPLLLAQPTPSTRWTLLHLLSSSNSHKLCRPKRNKCPTEGLLRNPFRLPILTIHSCPKDPMHNINSKVIRSSSRNSNKVSITNKTHLASNSKLSSNLSKACRLQVNSLNNHCFPIGQEVMDRPHLRHMRKQTPSTRHPLLLHQCRRYPSNIALSFRPSHNISPCHRQQVQETPS